jgi:hypothetical protein
VALLQRPCRQCGCPLVFAEGPNGKAIPLDTRSPTYWVTKDGKAERAEGVFVSHFTTCPKASDFSARKKSPGSAGAAPTGEGGTASPCRS